MTERSHDFRVFGTRARVLAGDPDAAARVEARLRGMHATLTRFDPASELSRLNARAGAEVGVSGELLAALAAALAAAEHSGGLVDPVVLDALEAAGYAESRDGAEPAPLRKALAAAPPRRPARPHPAAAWRAIRIDGRRGTVRLPAGARVDLGGSAKGHAADVAAALLAGEPAFAVDVGGDIRLGGTARLPRVVHVEHPLRDPEPACSFSLVEGAVATSGLRTRIWRTDGGFAHHLIDPAAGTPAWTGVVQATALAPTALEAEALAKAALLSGPERGRAVLERHGGVLVLDSGDVVRCGALAALEEAA